MSESTADLLRRAVDRLATLHGEATPSPWSGHVAHGRDITDEGYSYYGLRAGSTELAMMFHEGDREGDRPDEDLALIVALRNAAPALLGLLRQAAAHVEDEGRGTWTSDDVLRVAHMNAYALRAWPHAVSAARAILGEDQAP